jgi:radical SAM protein with 4Fe4S-binding SPASM domain
MLYHYPDNATVFELSNEDIIISLDQVPTWIKTSLTGKYLLQIMNTPRSLEELTESLSLHYDLPPEAVRPIIAKTVSRFVQEGIVQVEDGTPIIPRERQSIEDFHLQQVWFNITDACNLHCPHCFARQQKAQGFAPLHESLTFLKEAAQMEVDEIVFSGGEPTLHPQLMEILEGARGLRNWKVKLLTNGFMAGEEGGEARLMEICKLVDDVQVSIDGNNKSTHDLARGVVGSFERACKTVRIVASTGTQVGISFTPLPRNLKEIPKLYKLAIDLRANYIHLNRPKPPAAPNLFKETEQFTSEEFLGQVYSAYDELLIACHKSYEDMRGLPVKLPSVDSSFDPASELISPFKKLRCGAGILTMAVNYKGDAFPCAALTQERAYIGNVFSQGLPDISAKGRHMMLSLFSVDENEQCSKCSFRYYCGGGCRATAQDISACDCMCQIIQDRYIDFWEGLSLPIIRTGLGQESHGGKEVPQQRC